MHGYARLRPVSGRYHPLMLLVLVFGPVIAAVVLGLLQLAVYQGLVATRLVAEDQVPPFAFLLLRGFLGLLAVIAVGAMIASATREGPDPNAPEFFHQASSPATAAGPGP